MKFFNKQKNGEARKNFEWFIFYLLLNNKDAFDVRNPVRMDYKELIEEYVKNPYIILQSPLLVNNYIWSSTSRDNAFTFQTFLNAAAADRPYMEKMVNTFDSNEEAAETKYNFIMDVIFHTLYLTIIQKDKHPKIKFTQAVDLVNKKKEGTYFVNFPGPKGITDEHLQLSAPFTHNWEKNILKYSIK